MNLELVKFKALNLEERKKMFEKATSQFQDMIPIIIEDSTRKIGIHKFRFMVKRSATIFMLTVQIRKEMKFPVETAIFFYTKNKVISSDSLLSSVYDEHKSEDGFLYLWIKDTQAFG